MNFFIFLVFHRVYLFFYPKFNLIYRSFLSFQAYLMIIFKLDLILAIKEQCYFDFRNTAKEDQILQLEEDYYLDLIYQNFLVHFKIFEAHFHLILKMPYQSWTFSLDLETQIFVYYQQFVKHFVQEFGLPMSFLKVLESIEF